jgi:DNA polymerase III epsilon subunit-like protein
VIVFDTESTGLVKPGLARLAEQPHLIEIAAVKLVGGAIVDRFERLIKPPVVISAEITKITGITNAMVADADDAVTVLGEFAAFVLGEDTLVAHNLPHDRGCLGIELTRCGQQFNFPWPMYHVCTVERTSDLGLPDRKLTTLYKHLFGEPLKQTHRSMGDVEALARVVLELQTRGRLGI